MRYSFPTLVISLSIVACGSSAQPTGPAAPQRRAADANTQPTGDDTHQSEPSQPPECRHAPKPDNERPVQEETPEDDRQEPTQKPTVTDLCRQAWHALHGTDNDPFQITRSTNTWDLGVDVDGVHVDLRPIEYTEYTVPNTQPLVRCHVPRAFRARYVFVDFVYDPILQHTYTADDGLPTSATGGIVTRELPSSVNPMLSVYLTWFIKPGMIPAGFTQRVCDALHIPENIFIDLDVLVELPPLQTSAGIAVAIAKEADAMQVKYWGMVTDFVRSRSIAAGTYSHLLPVGEPPHARSVVQSLNQASFYNLQNLTLWDAIEQRRPPCKSVGPWYERCGYILTAHAREVVQQARQAQAPFYVHMVWLDTNDTSYLTRVQVDAATGNLSASATRPLPDLTAVGLPPIADLRRFTWP